MADRAPNEEREDASNRRNGASAKTVITASGKVMLNIARDRNGTFDPLLIAQYQRHFREFDTRIISMYVDLARFRNALPRPSEVVQPKC